MVDFRGLNNEHLVFIYLHNKHILDEYDKILEEGGISQSMNTPLGNTTFTQELPEESLKELNKSDRLKYYREIHEILEPIVEAIADGDEESYTKALNASYFSDLLNGADEDEDEEM